MKRAVCAGLVLIPALTASADEVFLVGGGRVSGVVVERTPTSLTLEVGPGRLTLPLSRVERVVAGRSALIEYRERAQALARDDAQGWLDLALWARDRGLLTQAGEAFERVLGLDPQNAAVHQALGNVRQGDRWLSREESYRARGYVPFEGGWMMPEERDAILADRAARDRAAAERARIQAAAQVAEAEARARAAEAEARRSAEGQPFPPFVSTGTFILPPPVPGRGVDACPPASTPTTIVVIREPAPRARPPAPPPVRPAPGSRAGWGPGAARRTQP